MVLIIIVIIFFPHDRVSFHKCKIISLFLLVFFTATIQELVGKKCATHLNAHVVNRLLREKWKSIPNFFNGKILLKNVTLQILNFILLS